jgi:hypothetical protein
MSSKKDMIAASVLAMVFDDMLIVSATGIEFCFSFSGFNNPLVG